MDTRKLVASFGIYMRNDRVLGPWRTARYRLNSHFPAFDYADFACSIEMSTTPSSYRIFTAAISLVDIPNGGWATSQNRGQGGKPLVAVFFKW